MLQSDSARHWLVMIGLMAAVLFIMAPAVVAYCRQIHCAQCRAPFAVHPRSIGDLCRSCADVFDHRRQQLGRRRSLLRRIWRRAA